MLLTARALALDEIDRDGSRAAVLEAVKLAPDLVPAAALAGRRLAEAGEQRKAARILETAWKINPHPDIAETYANLRFGDSARERLARMQKLADKVPGQLEGALAVAHAALDAREFAAARAALAPYASAPTRRVATLMADIEEAEHGDEGRVREWMGRAMRASGDPVWTADGVVSDRWLPVSPNGRLDGFEWKLPLAEIGVSPPGDRGLAAAAEAARGHRRRAAPTQARATRDAGCRNRSRPSPRRRQSARPAARVEAGRAGYSAGAAARRSRARVPSRGRSGAGAVAAEDAWQRIRSCSADKRCLLAKPARRRYQCRRSADVAQR